MEKNNKKKTSGIVDNPFKNIPEPWWKNEDDKSNPDEEQNDTGKIRRVKDLLFEDD